MNLLKKILLEYAVLTDEESQAAQQAKKMGLVSKGFGNWADPNTGQTTHRTVDGKLVPVGQEEPDQDNKFGWDIPKDDPEFEKFRQAMAKGTSQTFEPTKDEPEPEPEPSPTDDLAGLTGAAKLMAIDSRQVNDALRATTESLQKKDKERKQYAADGIKELTKKYGNRWLSKARASGDQLTMVGPNGTPEKKSAGEWADLFVEMRISKNVGLGTDESRAGEAAIVHGLNEVINEYRKSPEDFQIAKVLGGLRKELYTIAKQKGSKLKKDWADVALNTTEQIIKDYGLENIEFVAWDTNEGNESVGSTGHGTSADMFLKLTDGDTVGVSLKKDFNVFILNGGLSTVLDGILEDITPESAAAISDRINMDAYFKKRQDAFMSLATTKGFAQEGERMEAACLGGEGECPFKEGGSDWKRIQKGMFSSAMDKIQSGQADNLTIDEMKILARVAGNSNSKKVQKQVQKIRAVANDTLQEVFNVAVQNDEFGDNLKSKVVEGLHLPDTLSVGLTGLDSFVSYFGPEKFDQEDLLKYFVTDPTDLQNLRASIRTGDKEAINKFFVDRISLTFDEKSGKAKINFRRTDEQVEGEPNYLSLAFCNIRERGIGAPPTFELGVSNEFKYILQHGPKISEWPTRARNAFRKKRQIEDDVEVGWEDPLLDQTRNLIRSLTVRELERINGY